MKGIGVTHPAPIHPHFRFRLSPAPFFLFQEEVPPPRDPIPEENRIGPSLPVVPPPSLPDPAPEPRPPPGPRPDPSPTPNRPRRARPGDPPVGAEVRGQRSRWGHGGGREVRGVIGGMGSWRGYGVMGVIGVMGGQRSWRGHWGSRG